MKQILAMVAILISCNSFAQLKVIINGKDTVLMKIPLTKTPGNRLDSNTYKMPNALFGFKDSQEVKGNNQQGFDVYQSQVDNMPVLKPDAANAASFKMPNVIVKKNVEISFSQSPVLQPNNTIFPKLKKLKLYKLPTQ